MPWLGCAIEPRLKVLVVGYPAEPAIESEMKELIDELCLTEQFEWRGRVDHLEVPKLLYNTRIGVVPFHNYTKFRRNIANKALEFIAARMVFIATDLPSQRLFLKHGQNAILYAPGDIDELVQALCSLEDDPRAAQQIADHAT